MTFNEQDRCTDYGHVFLFHMTFAKMHLLCQCDEIHNSFELHRLKYLNILFIRPFIHKDA